MYSIAVIGIVRLHKGIIRSSKSVITLLSCFNDIAFYFYKIFLNNIIMMKMLPMTYIMCKTADMVSYIMRKTADTVSYITNKTADIVPGIMRKIADIVSCIMHKTADLVCHTLCIKQQT